MKQKGILLVLLMFLLPGLQKMKAQSLVIRLNDGSENAELLSTVQKLSFSSGDLLVTFKSGAIDTYGLSTLQKLYFQTATSVNEQALAPTRIPSIWPNPANETISIQGIHDKADQLYIYKADGSLVLVKTFTSGKMTLDIHSLSPGLYLLRVDGYSSKFVKQ